MHLDDVTLCMCDGVTLCMMMCLFTLYSSSMYLAFSYALTAPSFNLQQNKGAVSLQSPIHARVQGKKKRARHAERGEERVVGGRG